MKIKKTYWTHPHYWIGTVFEAEKCGFSKYTLTSTKEVKCTAWVLDTLGKKEETCHIVSFPLSLKEIREAGYIRAVEPTNMSW